jgi:MFS family permease
MQSPAPSEPATSPWAEEVVDPRGRGPITRLFVAVTLSFYGDWLTTVALLVVLFESTHNPAAPAGYVLARVAPRVVGPWLGGGLADRLSPRRVMVTASTVQAIFTAALIVFNRGGVIWAIYAAVAIAQFAGALSRPSQGAILPTLVRDRSLARANATYGMLLSISIFTGPAIGAALLLRIGPDPLFALDALSFAIAAALAATLPSQRVPVGAALIGVGARSASTSKRPAALMALRDPVIRMVAAAAFASGLTPTVAQAVLVVGAHERFGGDSSVGYLYASVGLGGILGGLIALRWIPARRWTRFAVGLVVLLEVVALAGFSFPLGVTASLFLLALSAAAGSSVDTWGMTEIQRRAPAGSMGRFTAVIFGSMYSGMLVGAFWALGTADLLHWDAAIELSCAAMVVLIALTWITGGIGGQNKEEPGGRGNPQGRSRGDQSSSLSA